MKRKRFSIILAFTILCTLIQASPAISVVATPMVNIGDYVQMGKYYNEPILWRCVDIDENGPLMLADKIITIKPFDAAGSHKYLDGSMQDDYNGYSSNLGSNLWETSNIRSWLNSAKGAGNVEWLDGCPPASDKVLNGFNDYENEKGFLAEDNFALYERNAIKSVSQKSLLSGVFANKLNEDGIAVHNYISDITKVVQNYNTAFYQNITDKMFLLDVKQINKIYQNSAILGADYYRAKPTQKAVDNSDYKYLQLTTEEYWYYWLRTPYAISNLPSNVRYAFAQGRVYHCDAYYGHIGVRPAFYLDLSAIINIHGNGSAQMPYSVETFMDVTAPNITVADYSTAPTMQSITVTASTNEGTLNETSHTFLENGSFIFIATDEAGNIAEKTVTITNIIKKGDTNFDGKITAVDALKVLQAVSGRIVLTEAEKMAADINGDGRVTAVDALKILQYVSGRIKGF